MAAEAQPPRVSAAEVARVFRAQYGRAIAVLVRAFGDIDLAEDAVADAFARAVELWPSCGLPVSPAGWIIMTAKNGAIDRLRRGTSQRERNLHMALLQEPDGTSEEAAPLDDSLRLLFTCCHPALALETRVGLTLRLLGGLTTAEIARAFLVSERTMAQRLVRAKAKIRDARIPYRVPNESELSARLLGVRTVIYLIFNEGYLASSGADLVRETLSQEAIRLGRLLVEVRPNEAENLGLLALMLLFESRRSARRGADGELVPLGEQDRTRWDRALIAEGQVLVQRCLAHNKPDSFQIQAALNAVHSDAKGIEDTDWRQILALYDQLLVVSPSPVVALNRAVAIAELEGPRAALALIDALDLEHYYLFHAIRADLLDRLGHAAAAKSAYDAAIARTENEAERRFLRKKRDRS